MDSVNVEFQENKKNGLNEKIGYIKKFKFEKILSNDIFSKRATVLGSVDMGTGQEEKSIITIEKTVFSDDWLMDMLNNLECIQSDLVNDIYHSFVAEFRLCNQMKGISIYPADEKTIRKYSPSKIELFSENYTTYETILLPYVLEKMIKRNQWIENMLDGTAEADRLLYSYENGNEGFAIFPDLKWDGRTIENIYLLAIARDPKLLSLRDLNQDHLVMLRKIREASYELITTKYEIPQNRIRLFVHYHPSFWRFHVHIKIVSQEETTLVSFRDNLLDQVIANIEAAPDYYQKVTLVCPLIKDGDIYKLYHSE